MALHLCLDLCLPVAEAFCPLPRSRCVNSLLFLFGPHYSDSSITGFVTLSHPIRRAAFQLFFIFLRCPSHKRTSWRSFARLFPSGETQMENKRNQAIQLFSWKRNPLLRVEDFSAFRTKGRVHFLNLVRIISMSNKIFFFSSFLSIHPISITCNSWN